VASETRPARSGTRRAAGGWRAQLIEEEAFLGHVLRPTTIPGGEGSPEQRSSSSQPHSRRIALGLVASDAVSTIGALFTVQVLTGGWPIVRLRLLTTLTLVPVFWRAVFIVFGLYERDRPSEGDEYSQDRRHDLWRRTTCACTKGMNNSDPRRLAHDVSSRFQAGPKTLQLLGDGVRVRQGSHDEMIRGWDRVS
jgi:hypothetical protein